MPLDSNMPEEASPASDTINQIPPIASIWRRIGASMVDSILLGILGQIIGLALVAISVAFQIGPYGRIIGLVIVLAYFGMLNSSIGNGKTVGKRLLKIAVRGNDGATISPGRSICRALVLFLPITLNGWALPVHQMNLGAIAIRTVIVFGIGGALVYTMLFNWKTRQGFHDILCKTFVVKPSGLPILVFPKTRRVHWLISGVLVALPVILIGIGLYLRPTTFLGADFSQMQGSSKLCLPTSIFFPSPF